TFLRKLIPGAASTSYGIYCAQLAGLPQSIIGRAYELLDGVEASDVQAIQSVQSADSGSSMSKQTVAADASMYNQAEAPNMLREASVVQLSIFGETAAAEERSVKGKKQ